MTANKPFPGLDPFLESQRYWRDFHSKFINCLQEELLKVLPSRYDARIDEEVYLARTDESRFGYIQLPDVAILETSRKVPDLGGVAIRTMPEVDMRPVTLPHIFLAEFREAYVHIIERERGTIVTVIELLSKTNKIGPGRKQYLKKRKRLRHSRTSLVEIDLLQVGRRLPLAAELPAGHCFAMVTRGSDPLACDVYAWRLEQPLPTIPIPLMQPDPDVRISLQDVFSLAYERGQYAAVIRYLEPLQTPLDEPTRSWAEDAAKKFAG